MEGLRNLGIDPNVPISEIIPLLSSQPTDCLLQLREGLFEDLRLKGLVHVGDELVSRRCTRRDKPLPIKLSEDVCSLVHCLKNEVPVPCYSKKMESGTGLTWNRHELLHKVK